MTESGPESNESYCGRTETPLIIAYVRGGLIDHICVRNLGPYVFETHDYDIEGVDENILLADSEGEQYFIGHCDGTDYA